MKELLVAAAVVACGVVWAEFREWLPWIAKRIIAQAVAAIPPEVRERMHEELSAELTAIPGKISPLIFASSVYWGFWRTAIVARLNVTTSQHAVRITDVILGSLVIIWLAPVLLVSMLATSLSSRSPALRITRCSGRNNQEFALLRIRTRDPRTGNESAFGRFIRKTRLEWIPALFNVVRGEMSLVGPAPGGHRPVNCRFIGLKPGLIWFRTGSWDEVDSFGKSASKTLKTYFRLLYAAIIATFFCPYE